jgi:hypothetical protein
MEVCDYLQEVKLTTFQDRDRQTLSVVWHGHYFQMDNTGWPVDHTGHLRLIWDACFGCPNKNMDTGQDGPGPNPGSPI